MPGYIDPATFEGQLLLLKRIGANDYSVRIGGKVAGRIMAQPRAGGRVVWLWTMTVPNLPGQLRRCHGESDTRDEAKAVFRSKFDRWRAWAAMLQHEVVWHG